MRCGISSTTLPWCQLRGRSGSGCVLRLRLLWDSPSPRLQLSVFPAFPPLALQAPGLVTVRSLPCFAGSVPALVGPLPCPHLCKLSLHLSLWLTLGVSHPCSWVPASQCPSAWGRGADL